MQCTACGIALQRGPEPEHQGRLKAPAYLHQGLIDTSWDVEVSKLGCCDGQGSRFSEGQRPEHMIIRDKSTHPSVYINQYDAPAPAGTLDHTFMIQDSHILQYTRIEVKLQRRANGRAHFSYGHLDTFCRARKSLWCSSSCRIPNHFLIRDDCTRAAMYNNGDEARKR